MLRALLLATLVSLVTSTGGVQAQSVLHLKVVIVDAAGKAVPVPRYLLLISDNPPTSSPRRVSTALDGTADVRLRPGNYTVESDQPFAYQGKVYQWTQMIDVPAGGTVSLELNATNAETDTAASVASTASLDTKFALLLGEWQDSVVSVWTPTAHAPGFAIGSGLIATHQPAIAGASSIEVQLSPSLKVPASVVAADPERRVAVLAVDPGATASVKTVPAACTGTPGDPIGREVATIGTTIRHIKRMTSGTTSGAAAHLVATDLTLAAAAAGGPVFAADGRLAGLTTIVGEYDDGDARLVPVADVCEALATAAKKVKEAPAPSGTLPVEPAVAFPLDALKGAADRRTSVEPYRLTSDEFDVALITPAMVYASQNMTEQQRRARAAAARSRGEHPLSDPLDNFSNWSRYVADAPPVLLVRVTPRFVEGFWTKVARGAASTQGVRLPPIRRFKAGFAKLQAFCGDAAVLPIHPFRLEQRVSETDAIYEGLYAFDPGALAPSCGTVKLVLYSEKDPNKADPRVLDAKIVQQLWDDFKPLRDLNP